MEKLSCTKQVAKKRNNMLDRSEAKSIAELISTESTMSLIDKKRITWTPAYYRWRTRYAFKESHTKYMRYFLKTFRVHKEKSPFVGFDITQEQYEYIKEQKQSPREYVEAKLREFLNDDF